MLIATLVQISQSHLYSNLDYLAMIRVTIRPQTLSLYVLFLAKVSLITCNYTLQLALYD